MYTVLYGVVRFLWYLLRSASSNFKFYFVPNKTSLKFHPRNNLLVLRRSCWTGWQLISLEKHPLMANWVLSQKGGENIYLTGDNDDHPHHFYDVAWWRDNNKLIEGLVNNMVIKHGTAITFLIPPKNHHVSIEMASCNICKWSVPQSNSKVSLTFTF